jgi:hypothetical protein
MTSLSHLEFLVEEPSAEAALDQLLPCILGADVSFKIYQHSGKSNLLRNLGARLRGYRRWLPADWGVVVLVDRDGADCRRLKDRLEATAGEAGLLTTSQAGTRKSPQVLNRLAIEELESWFFGDNAAISTAYPGVPTNLNQRAPYRDPDAISGGTAEALERVLNQAGYHQGGLAKIQAARDIAAHMEPDRNRSASFQVFRRGLLAFTQRGR